MKRRLKFRIFPSWQNALLALLAAGLLIVAFPDFEWWWTAWLAHVPLMWAVEREGKVMPSFMLGWLFGTSFFFGTCWWLTYAPIHYAGVPAWLAYLLVFTACLLTGLFPGLFAAILARLLQRFGTWAFLAAPFVWVFTEFARYWVTGNNWNAVGYSQAFYPAPPQAAALGGVYLCTFWSVAVSSLSLSAFQTRKTPDKLFATLGLGVLAFLLTIFGLVVLASDRNIDYAANVVALQPNVPASGLTAQARDERVKVHERLAADGLAFANQPYNKLPNGYHTITAKPTLVIFPESPMNFAYNDDREFQRYVRDFTTTNNVSLLFNSAEPDRETGRYFNSAVMVGPDGKKVAQYDKVYLLPFGEAVPFPFEGLMPAVVGSFAYGKNYSLVPVGDAKAGVMICFESHFGQLSREYVKQGADVIIEMTNDGYLGPTPVLRQHLANAVFRAVETNRPILRVTNVGITAYITETGQVLDPAPTYQEATRVWSVSKSDGSQTFYVKYGDWFAWLCTVMTLAMLIFTIKTRDEKES